MPEEAGEDEAAFLTQCDRINFWLENYVSEEPTNKFKLLLWVLAVILFINSILFVFAADKDITTSVFIMVQTLLTGGYDDTYDTWFPRAVFLTALVSGVVVFAGFLGLVNEQVITTFDAISEGKTKVACSDHTLILGWNESTVRCACQLAFLRRAYQRNNETCRRRLFPWTRSAPSTPAAAGKIVIMCNTKTKEEMDESVREALLERGIKPFRTRVGTDVICRIGDPTEPHDLLRVGAHRAAGVLTMMTEEDLHEEEESNGGVVNGVTLKTLLALKCAIFGQNDDDSPFWDKFRCVLHLEASSPNIDAAIFKAPTGRECVHRVDLTGFVNSMMFTSALNPLLPDVMLELMNFDGCAFRATNATDLGLVGKKVYECSLIWQDAVFCGVMNKDVILQPTLANFNEGLACNPDRIITADDRVYIIGESSFPKRRISTATPLNLGHVDRLAPKNLDVLVGGWSKAWSRGSRLAQRIKILTSGALPGSNIVLMNQNKDMSDILDKAKDENGRPAFQKIGEKRWEVAGMHVTHVEKDSGDAEALREVMRNEGRQVWPGEKFEVIIVLGQSAKPLPKRSQDMRLLSKYVLVHKIHEEVFGPDLPLHVIGENHFDSTVSLVKAVTSKRSKKDLVNTQAMFARGLVQVLAYPRMQSAIKQMFEESRGTPSLKIYPVGRSFIPAGSCTFADITRTIQDHQHLVGAICLGVVLDSEIKLSPDPDEEFELDEHSSIVVIERGEGWLPGATRLPRRDWSRKMEFSGAHDSEDSGLLCSGRTNADDTESDSEELTEDSMETKGSYSRFGD